MNRSQLEHIIRASGSIVDDHEIIVIGSASVLSQFPDLDERFVFSVEADVFPKNKPDLSDLIDGSIGELSPFHTAFGYYAHGVSRETADNLPSGWDARLIPIKNKNTGGVTGWCVEIHDLVAGKYVSARDPWQAIIDARMYPTMYDLDSSGTINTVEEWLLFQQDVGAAWYFSEEDNTWMHEIADLVVTEQGLTNMGTKTLQVRFYPRSTTVFPER